MSAALITSALVISFAGCGLRRELFEELLHRDAGRDAGDCVQRLEAGSGRCLLASPTCEIPDPCPATWDEANSQSSCTGTAEVKLGSCGEMNSWSRFRRFSVLTCYYDAASGKLQGVHVEADDVTFCDGQKNELWVGNAPTACSLDGSTGVTGAFTCPTGFDAGANWLDPVPCGNKTCGPRQYCRSSNLGATCDATAGTTQGVCTDMPTSCGLELTCGCLAGLDSSCSCCFPRGGGTISCSRN
jgi:hypothetical protein